MSALAALFDRWVRDAGRALGAIADSLFALLGTERRQDTELLRRKDGDPEARYAKLRLWIATAFGLDVIATVVFVLSASVATPDFEAWYERSFPANMVIVRNHGRSHLREVELVIDGRYRLEVDRLAPGPTGFPFNQEFRDGSNTPPPASYVPHELEIRSDGDSVKIPFGKPTR